MCSQRFLCIKALSAVLVDVNIGPSLASVLTLEGGGHDLEGGGGGRDDDGILGTSGSGTDEGR